MIHFKEKKRQRRKIVRTTYITELLITEFSMNEDSKFTVFALKEEIVTFLVPSRTVIYTKPIR